jgi:mannose-6-phosphate isomerase-like protein (cupin superfamily)
MRSRWISLGLLAIVLSVACVAAARTQPAAQALPPVPAPGGGAGQAPPKAMNGEGKYFSADALQKAYVSPTTTMVQIHLAWTPEYRLSVVKRPYAEPAAASSEMHEDKTQIYMIIAGTGTQVLGGKPMKDNASAEGQHSSTGPLEGGVSYRIKPGDVILIPPMTWHQTLPDAGQTIVYTMVHMETRTRLP